MYTKGMVGAFLFLILFLPGLVAAEEQQPQEVVINEIAWMGTPVEGVDSRQHWRYEWVELFNSTERNISLDGWALEFSREEPEFLISLSGVIPSGGYFLVAASDKIPGVDVNYANLGGKFMNTSMRVVLKNAPGSVIDEVDAKDGWPGGDNESKRTMERQAGSDPTIVWQTSSNAGGTPKQENSKGLEQLLSLANKKGPQRPSQESLALLNSTTLSALVLALLSSGAAVLLRRRLLRA